MKYLVAANPRIADLPKMERSLFTLAELQAAFEKAIGEKLDKRNFRKSLSVYGVVREANGHRDTGRRPARLYRYTPGRKKLVVLG